MRSGFLVPGAIGPVSLAGGGLADPVPVAGAELLANGDFSAWTGDNPDGWTLAIPATSDIEEAAGGTARFYRGAASGAPYISQVILTSHSWYMVATEIVSVSTPSVAVQDLNNVLSATYQTPGAKIQSGRVASTSIRWYMTPGGADAVIDNLSCRKLTLSSLISARAYASADCDISVAVTRTAGTQAGISARVDSATSPANFIIAYLDGAGNVKVDKAVLGVYTNVISGAITYVAGQVLRLVCSGTTVMAYYNGLLVGSAGVADAGIVSNVRHGKFSTYAANTFADYIAA